MKLTAKVVPFSSIVGSSVMLHDESGNVVCQLALLNTARGDDPSECRRQQEALAQEVASRFLSTPVSAASPEGEATVPEGFVLVPVEPTEAMMSAAADSFFDAATGHVPGAFATVNEPFRRFYRAMLAVVPATHGKTRK